MQQIRLDNFEKSTYKILLAVAYNSDIDHPALSKNVLDEHLPGRSNKINGKGYDGIYYHFGTLVNCLTLGANIDLETFLKASEFEERIDKDDNGVYQLTDSGIDTLTQLHSVIYNLKN